jgi:hypothetical protein
MTTEQAMEILKTRQFTLDGMPINIVDFMSVNMLEPDEVRSIFDLPVGGEVLFGGGAFATFTFKRVEDK